MNLGTSYLAIAVMIAAPLRASAGAVTVEGVIKQVSGHPEAAQTVMSLLAERNLIDTHCDFKYYSDRDPEILCNADDNSLIAFKNLFGAEKPVVEHRLDQQANVGINPVD